MIIFNLSILYFVIEFHVNTSFVRNKIVERKPNHMPQIIISGKSFLLSLKVCLRNRDSHTICSDMLVTIIEI